MILLLKDIQENIMKILVNLILVFLLNFLSAYGDQLQWISHKEAEKANKYLESGTRIISYCSNCDDQYIEVREIIETTILEPSKGWSEIQVTYKEKYRSEWRFDSGHYREPIEYEESKFPEDLKIQTLDLAYVYVETDDGVFSNLGKLLNMECYIKVEKINLPYYLLEEDISYLNQLKKDIKIIDKQQVELLEKDSSTLGMLKASNYRYKELDKMLNKYYKILSSKLDSQAKQELVNTQRAWINYRDTQIKFIEEYNAQVYGMDAMTPVITYSAINTFIENKVKEFAILIDGTIDSLN